MDKIKTIAEISAELTQFFGSENYYKVMNLNITDGVKYLADRIGAYWVITTIGSYQTAKLKEKYPFQLWEIKSKDSRAVITMKEDSDQPAAITQTFGYTDFPEGDVKFYCIDGVLLLPSEY